MCGISGAFWLRGVEDGQSRIDASLIPMKTRGPDGQGTILRNVGDSGRSLCGMGHTRLSILDLSSLGRQPMTTRDGKFAITYNGEIYNYVELREELKAIGYDFATETDTEVLITAWQHWGEASLNRFVGMFAFAIIDFDSQRLICARDNFGIKPLMYMYDPSSKDFYFASDWQSILLLAKRKGQINFQRAYDYLVHGEYDRTELSMVDGVRHLPTGSFVELCLKTGVLSSVRQYWYPSYEETSRLKFSDAAERMRDIFLKSVKMHMRSDVPLGVTLSGGLDSSAIACAVRYLNKGLELNTFSYVASGFNESEEYWIDIVNQYTNAKGNKCSIDPSVFIDSLDELIVAQGEPFGGISICAEYYVLKMAREKGITVVLCGHGADEMLAGYQGYPSQRGRSLINKGQYLELLRLLLSWSEWPGRSKKAAFSALARAITPQEVLEFFRRYRDRARSHDWLFKRKISDLNIVRERSAIELVEFSKGRQLSGALAFDLTKWRLMNHLRYTDRSGMKFSVEGRVPFLTSEMAEFALSVPEHFLLSNTGETKSLFRESMRGIIPEQVLFRKDKVGFATPDEQLLRAVGIKILDWIEPLSSVPFIDFLEVRRIASQVVEGRRPYSSELWRWINFSKWAALNGF